MHETFDKFWWFKAVITCAYNMRQQHFWLAYGCFWTLLNNPPKQNKIWWHLKIDSQENVSDFFNWWNTCCSWKLWCCNIRDGIWHQWLIGKNESPTVLKSMKDNNWMHPTYFSFICVLQVGTKHLTTNDILQHFVFI